MDIEKLFESDNVKRYTKIACVNCKLQHLQCDSSRPCKRCFRLGKLCLNSVQQKRGRPRKNQIMVESSTVSNNDNISMDSSTQVDTSQKEFINTLYSLSLLFPSEFTSK